VACDQLAEINAICGNAEDGELCRKCERKLLAVARETVKAWDAITVSGVPTLKQLMAFELSAIEALRAIVAKTDGVTP
jgi:hypothetical protein